MIKCFYLILFVIIKKHDRSVITNFVELWLGEYLSPNQLIDRDYYALLSQEEKKKADSFARLELQQKYSQTRGILRTILGTHLNCHPQKVMIKTGQYGKPFVADNVIHFNLSHTGNRFVIAISNCTELGVDIEQCIPRKSLPALAKKCFSTIELGYWTALPEEEKVAMFFRFWVRKEAFVKAVGRGIALGLEQCIVNPDNQRVFLAVPESYGHALDWAIIAPATNNLDVCAVVTKNIDFETRLFQWA